MITLKRDEKEKEKESEASAVKRGRWTKEDVGGEKKTEAETAAKDDKTKTEEEQMETTTETAAEVTTGNFTRYMTFFLFLNQNLADFKCSGLSKDQSEALLRAAVGLISVPVEPDALNAILRLCLRLTRTFSQAR